MSKSLLRTATPFEDEFGLHAVPLDVLLLKKYGPIFLTWESEALLAEVEEDFGPTGQVTWARVESMRLLHVNQTFWTEWEVFENVTAAIAGNPPVFSYVQPPEPEEIALALHVAQQVDNSHKFDDDVLGYMAAALLYGGLWYLEGSLEIVGPALADHDRRKRIERDYGSVAVALKDRTAYYPDPETAAEVQANIVLSIRKALHEYESAEQKQLVEVDDILRGAKQ